MAATGETVLVVEDDPGVAMLQRRHLERAGFHVAVAATVAEALARVAEGGIDLAVLDFRLPGGITGLDLHTQLKAAGHNFPVIMVTGFSDEETAVRALRSGVRDFVAKSSEYLDYLPEAVSRVLRQNRLEESLRRSEERFRVLTDVSPQIVWEGRTEIGLTYCNQRWTEFTGLTVEESLGDGWTRAMHPDHCGRVVAAWADAAARKAAYDVEYPLRRADGEYRWHLARGLPLIDDSGAIVKWIGVALDIHDRRAAEQALRESEQRFQAFMDNSPAATFIKDEDGRMVYGNATLARQFGLTREDWLGKNDFELWPEETARRLRENDLAVLNGGRTVELVEEVPAASGTRYWAVHKFPFTDGTGRRFLAGTAVDITERRKAEAALHEKEAQLRQAQKLEAIGQLAGGVAHEYNNLLQAILGYASFALDSLTDDHPACDDLRQIEKATDRAASLTRQLLGFSRRQPLRRSNLNANEVVADLLKMLRPIIGADVEVRTDLAADAGVVHADSALLQQMLLNLCVNARDAMPSGGRLTIRTQNTALSDEYCELNPAVPPGRYVLFTVADTGCGMSAEVKTRIFEPFFTTKEVGKGTGLGLAMVYGVVQQHGGTIHVYSEPGEGTTFRVYLPAIGASESPEAVASPASAAGGLETVLVADDEPLVRNIAVRALQRAGYTVLTAEDGEEAASVFEEHADRIDLALLDVVMPKAGGDAVYRRIQELRPETAVIFCSGYDPDAKRTEFVLREGLTLLQKPFDLKALLRAVRDALDARPACRPTLAAVTRHRAESPCGVADE